MTTDFGALLACLSDAGVEFIIVGGVAGTIHGAGRATADLDVVYRRTPENMARVVGALDSLSPYPRGAPPGLPFTFDLRTIGMGVNFTLTTSAGLLDLLGEITGGGPYELDFCTLLVVTPHGRGSPAAVRGAAGANFPDPGVGTGVG